MARGHLSAPPCAVLWKTWGYGCRHHSRRIACFSGGGDSMGIYAVDSYSILRGRIFPSFRQHRHDHHLYGDLLAVAAGGERPDPGRGQLLPVSGRSRLCSDKLEVQPGAEKNHRTLFRRQAGGLAGSHQEHLENLAGTGEGNENSSRPVRYLRGQPLHAGSPVRRDAPDAGAHQMADGAGFAEKTL